MRKETLMEVSLSLLIRYHKHSSNCSSHYDHYSNLTLLHAFIFVKICADIDTKNNNVVLFSERTESHLYSNETGLLMCFTCVDVFRGT